MIWLLGAGNSNMFLCSPMFTPKIGGRKSPNFTVAIFVRWIGKKNPPTTLRSSNIAMEQSTIWVDVFPIQDGDFPASYVCLPEANTNYVHHWFRLFFCWTKCHDWKSAKLQTEEASRWAVQSTGVSTQVSWTEKRKNRCVWGGFV